MLNESLKPFQDRVAQFAKDRDWDQFHSIKNLSMALGVECSELMEHFQWEPEERKLNDFSEEKKQKISDEMIDIFIYWLRLSTKMELNIDEAFERKFTENKKKYPAQLVKGSSKKYNEY